ncbi:MAG TPA: hypothetical protein VGI99_15550 [Gemmataceae bacterium]
MRLRSFCAGLLVAIASVVLVGINPGTADAQRNYRGWNGWGYPYYWQNNTMSPYTGYTPYQNGTYGRYLYGYPNGANRWFRYP